MADEGSTTKLSLDISQFRKAMQDARRQVRMANAEFKEATAGMQKWSDNADGLNAKMTQLHKTLSAQKSQLKYLESQYAQVAEKEGKTSKNAEELMIKITNQKAAIGKTKSDLEHYGRVLDAIQTDSKKTATGIHEVTTASQKLAQEISKDQNKLTSLRNEYANLTLEEKENSEEGQNLAKSIQDLSQTIENNKAKMQGAIDKTNALTHSMQEVAESSEESSDGFTILKGAISSLVSAGIDWCIEKLKELALEGEEAMDKFQASTGVSTNEMGKFRKEIMDLYKGNYGESINDVAEKMAKVKQVTGEMDPTKLKELTKNAITMGDTFGSDFTETIRGVQNLMTHFGLTAQEAFDLFAKGSQEGLDYTDELGDNVAEYGGNFKQAGYSAQEYFQLLKNGTKNGAYNLDKVNDSINEVKNRLADGSIEKSIDIFSSGTQKAFKNWQNGKGTMKDVIESIVKDINNCTNEQEALTMAQTAFGTMGEDANLKVVKSLTSVGDEFKNVKGTMENTDKTRWDNTKSQLQGIGRAIQVDFIQPLVSAAVPALVKFGNWFVSNTPIITASLNAIGAGLLVFNMSAIVEKATKSMGLFTGAITKLWNTILKNPYVLLASVLAGLIIGIGTYIVKTRNAAEEEDKNTQATNRLISEQKELNKTLKENKKNRDENVTSAKAEAKQADFYYSKLKSLMSVEKKSAAQKAQIKDYVDKLNQIMPDLNLKYNEEKDSLNKSTEAIRDNIAAQKELILAKAAQKNMESIASDIADLEIKQGDLVKQNTKNEEAYEAAQQKTIEARRKFIEAGSVQGSKEHQNYIDAMSNEARKKEAYDKTADAVEKNEKKLKKLNAEYNKTDKYAQKKLDSAEVDKQLASITEKCKKKGVEIPKAVSDGIKSGQYQVPETVEGMENLISFDKAVQKAGLEGVKIPKNLAEGISLGKVSANEAVKALEKVSELDSSSAAASAKQAGIDIPASLREGIASGQISVKEATAQLQSAANFNTSALVIAAKAAGIKIPQSLAQGIASGKISVENANKQVKAALEFFTNSNTAKKAEKAGLDVPKSLADGIASGKVSVKTAASNVENAISFKKALKEAGIKGKQIPQSLMTEIMTGKTSVKSAAKRVNEAISFQEAVKKAGKEGTKTANNLTKKILEGKTTAKEAGKQLAENGKDGIGSVDTTQSGENFSRGFKNGIGNLLGDVFEAAKKLGQEAHAGLKEGQKEGSPSKLTTQSGKYFTQGYINGIGALIKYAVKAARNVGTKSVDALETELDEHSPSKKTKKSGKNFTKGFVNGILSKKEQTQLKNAAAATAKSVLTGLVNSMTGAEKTLADVMVNMLSNVASTAKSVSNGKFTEAGSAAGEMFSNAIQDKLSTVQEKVTYQYEQQLAKFDSKINSLEKDKKDDLNTAKGKRDKALKQLKKSSKYKKASSKQKKKMVQAVKDKYTPGINAIEKAYNNAINAEKKKQEAYQKATEKSLAGFTEALSKFGSEAESLVAETIDGITETYQAKWDNLTNLQETMLSKLQGFGDLFTVSGAGVMTVNDIKKQTEDIKAYMENLNAIKGKVSKELFNQIAAYDVDQGKAFMEQLLAMSDAELKIYNDAFTEKMNVSEELSKNIYKSDFDNVSKDYCNAIDKAFKGLDEQLKELGKQCMSGFVSGLKEDTDYLSKVVKEVTNSIITEFKKNLQINSPSKITTAFGEFLDLGIVNGLKNKVTQVKKAVKEVASTTAMSFDMDSLIGAKASVRGGQQAARQSVTNVTYVTNKYEFTQNNTSPKALSRKDIYRQTKNQLAFAKGVI